MKILFIGRYCDDEILGGSEKVANRIFNIISTIYDCYFIEYFFDGKYYGYFKKFFGKEIVSDNKKKILRLGLFRILITIFKIHPNIIHIITFERFAIIVFLLKIFTRVKIIYNIHGLIKYENNNFRKVGQFENFKDKITEFIFLKLSNVLLFLSEDIVGFTKQFYKINKKKVYIIANGIDIGFHNAYLKRKYENNKILSIVFISDINRKEKGFDFLIDILENINFNLNLYIVGNNSTLDKKIIENDNVRIYSRDLMTPVKLSEFLQDKDIYISSSIYEPFSISAMESMATGIIPLLTKETGSSRFIEQGKNGFVFKYGDKKSFLETINLIKNNFELKKNIMSGSRHIYDELSWEKISQMYVNIYKSINEK
jgi:glycosyltransferase involved in cell wall biosynthesis